MADNPIYEEPTLRIDSGSITIKRYYFPLFSSKTIQFAAIESIAVRPTTFWTQWRIWGSSNLTNWLPLDTARPKKHQLIELNIGKRIRPTITPDNPDRVASLLQPSD